MLYSKAARHIFALFAMTAGLCLSSREAGAQNVRKFDPIKEDLKDRYGIIVDEDVTVSQAEIGAKPLNSMYIATERVHPQYGVVAIYYKLDKGKDGKYNEIRSQTLKTTCSASGRKVITTDNFKEVTEHFGRDANGVCNVNDSPAIKTSQPDQEGYLRAQVTANGVSIPYPDLKN